MTTMILCQTKIYKTPGGAYIDVTDRLNQQPEINVVESYGGTAIFSVVNNVENPLRNLLDDRCARWSDNSTGPVELEMYVEYVYDLVEKQIIDDVEVWTTIESEPLGYHMILNMGVSGEVITFTTGDAVQLLRSTGVDYYRDHYHREGMVVNKPVRGYWDNDNEQLFLVKPAEAQLYGGAAGDAQWALDVGLKHYTVNPDGGSSLDISYTPGSYARMRVEMEHDIISSMSVRLYGRLFLRVVRFRLYDEQFNVIKSFEFTTDGGSSSWATQTRTFDPIKVKRGGIYWFELLIVSPSMNRDVGIATGTPSKPNIARTFLFNAGDGRTTEYPEPLAIGLNVFEYANATGEEDTTDDTRWNVTAIEGVNELTSALAIPDFEGRARISYASPTQLTSVKDVSSAIIRAAGFEPLFQPEESGDIVSIFRCAGAMYLDYLLTLADIREDGGSPAVTGRRRVISANPASWDVIRMGLRHDMKDGPSVALYYAGDPVPNVNYKKQFAMNFSPNMMKKNRPAMSMVRSTTEDKVPILVALRDPEVGLCGSMASQTSSFSDVTSAAFQSYMDIMTNRSKDWEGEMNLSGIHTEYIDNGDFIGSGAVVSIWDSRYGMNNYPARVRSVKYNFKDLITTLTLNNYSFVYSNDAIDTEKMSFSAGAFAVAATTPEQLNRQYVRIDTDTSAATILPSGNTITLVLSKNGGILVDDNPVFAETIDIPELNSYFMSAYFSVSPVIGSMDPHGVVGIKINGGATISIPEYRRPDKYYFQSLIVNVQVHKL